MTWIVPTVEQLVTAQVRALTANLTGADAALAVNNLNPVAAVIGGGLHELHVAMDYTSRQKFILTCAPEFLDRHGLEMKPAVPRKQATRANGQVDVVSTGAISLATGAILFRSDGTQYTVTAGIVLAAAGSAMINVSAALPGAAGVMGAGDVLTASTGLTGPATFAVGPQGLSGGADIETNESYRSRLLFARAYPEHGGATPDWLRYTLAIPGVTRAFIDPLAAGRGTVVVYPFFDATRPNGIPLESDRLNVANALASVGPGAGLPVVRIAQAVPVNVSIFGLMPATPEVQLSVVSELAFTFARNSRVAGLSQPHVSMPFLATDAIFSRSWIWQAVANATGEERHSITLPAADIAMLNGQTAVLGAVTFV